MNSLMSSLKVVVTQGQYSRLETIENENFDEVAMKAARDLSERGIILSPSQVANGIFALKQYYAVAMLDPANAHAVSYTVDPFWHAHILFTERYFDFCDRVVGEYMHHTPLDHNSQPKVENVRTLYNYTVETLTRLFDCVDSYFWPKQVTDSELICFHKGNQSIYQKLQADRLFEPTPRGVAWAYTN